MALRLKDICYRYPAGGGGTREKDAGARRIDEGRSPFELRCDSFELQPGQSVSVCGDNGSGKSTLAKLICGVLQPQAGTVSVDERSLTGASLATFGREVGYVFQEPAHQLFAPTVCDELLFVGRLMGADPTLQAKRAERLLARLDLSDLRERSPLRLSRGEQQRLAIAAVLMQDPHYLVLDEPSSGLDDASAERLIELLAELRAQGTGLCLITHDARLSVGATQVREMQNGVLRP